MDRIADEATNRGQSWALLQHLTDRIGPRLSGSAGAEEAVRWTAERLGAFGFDARLEPVLVPHWVRGAETAEITGAPRRRLAVTALGGSVPTPAAGITAEVVVADGLEGLRALDPARVKGRKVDPGDLARSTAALAAMAWLLAEMPQTLPRPAPSPSASPSPAPR